MTLEELIDAICSEASPAERETILQTGSLLADGVPFTLVNGAAGDESSLYAYCDFGALPHQQTVAVLKRLLEINLFLYGRDTPSFVFNPHTEHVLLACRMDRGTLTAQRFIQSLREMGSYARQWQATRFLTDEDTDRPGSALPTGHGDLSGRPLPSIGVR
jgi:Tir chaperone protein (CesT) family